MSSIPIPPPGASLKTILIIDDDAHLAATLALGLEAHGYHTLCAHNAAVGWEMAHAHLPDLILCDIDMPGKDGRRLLQEMRADPTLANRQFVLMTGKPTHGNQRAGMDLGADDFLLKPFTHTALVSCVAARLRRAEFSRRVDDRAVDQLRESLGSALPQKFFMPLASIMGLAQLLEAEYESATKQDIREDLRAIQAAGRRLHRTLRNYLTIMDLEPPEAAATGALLDADAVQTALARGCKAAAESQGRVADVVLNLAGATLRGNPKDLGTLAEELVDNALSFSRKGTPVRVRAWSEAGIFHFTVTDTGRGLTPEQLQSIRSPDPQNQRLVGQQGRGLGLTLVAKLVARFGGTFEIESESGQGTTCRLGLPIPTADHRSP